MKRAVKKPATSPAIPECSENPSGDISAQTPNNKHPAKKIGNEYLCSKKEMCTKISVSLNIV
jgi:hypothetical protein